MDPFLAAAMCGTRPRCRPRFRIDLWITEPFIRTASSFMDLRQAFGSSLLGSACEGTLRQAPGTSACSGCFRIDQLAMLRCPLSAVLCSMHPASTSIAHGACPGLPSGLAPAWRFLGGTQPPVNSLGTVGQWLRGPARRLPDTDFGCARVGALCGQ